MAPQGGRARRRGGARGGSRDAGPEGLEPVPRRLLPGRRERAATRTTGARSRRPRRSAPTCSCWCAAPPAAADLAAARAMVARRASSGCSPYADRARRAAGDRAAAPDDDRRALGDRHARRGARHRRAVRRPRTSASWSTPTTCGGTRGSSSEIARAAGRIVGFHVNDWLSRDRRTRCSGAGMMGDGIIDLRGFRAMIEAAGYDGPIEVEILNPAIWDLPRAELMRTDGRALRAMRALARCAVRAARREPVRQHDVLGVVAAEDRVRGPLAHLVQRDGDRRQADEVGRARVVDAGDRDLAGHVHAARRAGASARRSRPRRWRPRSRRAGRRGAQQRLGRARRRPRRRSRRGSGRVPPARWKPSQPLRARVQAGRAFDERDRARGRARGT